MLTKDVTDQLNTIFNLLQQQGKEPTLALVKARLSTSVPIPALITALKHWKSKQSLPKIEVMDDTPQTQDERLTHLEQEVAELKLALQTLTTKLENIQ